jgi:hypothetical protein
MKEIINHKVFRDFILVQKLILFIFHLLSLRKERESYTKKYRKEIVIIQHNLATKKRFLCQWNL